MLIRNIGVIAGIDNGLPYRRGKELSDIEYVENAWLRIVDGVVAAFGSMDSIPEVDSTEETIDAQGGFILPAFCDSHTHLVYPGSRSGEFLDKINGLSYEEIASRGGGILNSADRLSRTSENELYREAMRRVQEVIEMGTGAIEIKAVMDFLFKAS